MGSLEQRQLQLQRKREIYLKKKEAKQNRKRRFIKFLVFTLIFILVFIFYDKSMNLNINFDKIKFDKININFDFLKKKDENTKKKESFESELEGKTIAYVPIDDRMIHTTKMKYITESLGYEMKMPDAKFYKTNIDKSENSYAGYSTKYGNPIRIAGWLEEMEEAGCDYYIISLDQLFSGGLIPSQYISDSDIEVYGKKINTVKKTFENIIEDSNNHVYLIDSVMGLSATPGFLDFTQEDYGMLIQFTSVNRGNLEGDNLNVTTIVENYGVDNNGASINTEMDLSKLSKYLAARERKLNYSKYIISSINKSNNKNVHLYIGIDDYGNSYTNIQNNDIKYINSLLEENNIKTPIREGVSTLSEVALGDMVLDSINQKLKVKVTYFGDSSRVVPKTTDSYVTYMDHLLDDLDISKDDSKYDLEVLVYNTNGSATDQETNTNNLLKVYLSNIKNKIPTVIINDGLYEQDKFLIDNLSNYEKTNIPMGYLVGYSNNNGFINSSRIALVEGITRVIYLNGGEKTDKKDKGFVKLLYSSFVEDMAYLPVPKNDGNLSLIETKMRERVNMINNNMTKGNIISDIAPYEEKGIRSVSASNYYFPWSRVNEIHFEVAVSLDQDKDIKIPEEVVYIPKNEG